jgi:hypothetical protein
LIRALLGLMLLSSCKKDDEVTYVQFNQTGDIVEVLVTDGDALGDVVDVVLQSSTGTVDVGTASVDPGSGPVGTDHELMVVVDDQWQDVVTHVTVLAEAGDRGTEEYTLRQDSADHGVWVLTLTSLGAESESRTDSFTLQLWQSVDLPASVGPSDTDG